MSSETRLSGDSSASDSCSASLDYRSQFNFDSAFTYSQSSDVSSLQDNDSAVGAWQTVTEQLIIGGAKVLAVLSLPISWPLVVRRVPQGKRAVTYRLGRKAVDRQPGLYLHLPSLDTDYEFDLGDTTLPVILEKVLTVDSGVVTLVTDVVYRITCADRFFVGYADSLSLFSSFVDSCLRRQISSSQLSHLTDDRLLVERDVFRDLTQSTQKWGLAVESLKIRDVHVVEQPPAEGATVDILRCLSAMLRSTSSAENQPDLLLPQFIVNREMTNPFGLQRDADCQLLSPEGGVVTESSSHISPNSVHCQEPVCVVNNTIAAASTQPADTDQVMSGSTEGEHCANTAVDEIVGQVERAVATVQRVDSGACGVYGLEIRDPACSLTITFSPDKCHVTRVSDLSSLQLDALVSTTSHVLRQMLRGSPEVIRSWVKGLVSVRGDLGKVRLLLSNLAEVSATSQP